MDRRQHQGRITGIRYRKGFGFIEFENQEVFFHKKNTLGNFHDYSIDDIVHFTLINSKHEKDKQEAIKVINESNIRSRERYLKSLEKGDIIEGRIRYKTANGYHIGLKYCTDGFLSFENISYVKSEDTESLFKKGEFIYMKVTKVDFKKKLIYLNFKNIILHEFWNGEEEGIEVGSVFNCRIKRKIMTQYGYSRLMLENDYILNYEFSLRRKLGIRYDELDRDEVYDFLGNVDGLFKSESPIMVKINHLEPEINKVVFSWWIENDYELERAEKVLEIAYESKVSEALKSQIYLNLLDITHSEYIDDIIAFKAKMEEAYPMEAEESSSQEQETETE